MEPDSLGTEAMTSWIGLPTNFPSSLGSVPLTKLKPFKFRLVSCVMPNSLGTEPLNWLYPRFSACKDASVPSIDDSVPLTTLVCRSKAMRLPAKELIRESAMVPLTCCTDMVKY
jgi:hypothetical protein